MNVAPKAAVCLYWLKKTPKNEAQSDLIDESHPHTRSWSLEFSTDEVSHYLSGQLTTSGWPCTLVFSKAFQLLSTWSKQENVF